MYIDLASYTLTEMLNIASDACNEVIKGVDSAVFVLESQRNFVRDERVNYFQVQANVEAGILNNSTYSSPSPAYSPSIIERKMQVVFGYCKYN